MAAILLAIIAATCTLSIVIPSIGVIAYYVLAIANPQTIWPWIFGDIRISLIVSTAAIAGAILAGLRGRLNQSALNTTHARLLITLVVLVNLSHWFSPFTEVVISSLPASVIVSTFNKVVLFYLISIVVIQNEFQWRMLVYSLAGTAIYYTYYANLAYFSGEYWKFGDNGRLSGPGGLYRDENGFALVFVVGFPVVYYLAVIVRRRWIAYSLFACIPPMLHALLLTGSRGALLSVGMAGLYMAYSMKSKILAGLLLIGAALFVVDQGGTVVNRVDDTFERGQILEEDEAIDPRIRSWQIGMAMVLDRPLLGVGAGKFESAALFYSEGIKSVAHNTFLQFASNSGLAAGLIYISCFMVAFKDFRRERSMNSLLSKQASEFHIGTRRMLTAAMIGFLTSSIFLDLMLYEILYLIFVLHVTRKQLILSGSFTNDLADPG